MKTQKLINRWYNGYNGYINSLGQSILKKTKFSFWSIPSNLQCKGLSSSHAMLQKRWFEFSSWFFSSHANFQFQLKIEIDFWARVSSPASSDFSFAERRSSIFDPDYFRIGSWEAMMTMVVVINWLRRLMWFSFSSNGCFPRLVKIHISVCTTSCPSFQQSLVQAVAWLQVQSVSRLAITHIKGSP